jgi:hypothetical protein
MDAEIIKLDAAKTETKTEKPEAKLEITLTPPETLLFGYAKRGRDQGVAQADRGFMEVLDTILRAHGDQAAGFAGQPLNFEYQPNADGTMRLTVARPQS